MNANDLPYQIALSLLPGIGDISAKKLLAHCGNAESVFKTKSQLLQKIQDIGPKIIHSINNHKGALERAEKEINYINKHHIQVLFYQNTNYPKYLKQFADCPFLLYYKGNLDFNKNKVVSIVGTRMPSNYGKQMTTELVKELTPLKPVIVSGLAYGIDYIAHKTALENNLQTIGILGHGLDKLYPAEHKNIANAMIEQGGILTEFLTETNPDKENFPKRNRIVAGICDALVVVESKRKGGSLITAVIANSYNKDVFAFPGQAKNDISEGCNGLIKTNKAQLIESAEDLIYQMNWNEDVLKQKKQQISLLPNLSETDLKIINAFQTQTQLHVDEICLRTELTLSQTFASLLQLEFENVIKPLPGKMYELVK